MSSCGTRRRRGGENSLNNHIRKNNAAASSMNAVAANAANAAKANANAGNNASKMMGGKRKKTRRLSKGASEWTKKVTKLYHEMKAKDSSVKFMHALKRASQLKKKGQL